MGEKEQPVFQQTLFRTKRPASYDAGPATCLGMTFPNYEECREYFLEKLREKLQDPEFRSIEGFPIGSDEDILALSDPPYYTACPNPFIENFIKCYGKPYDPAADDYRREPFAADVSEGKNDPIYNAHSYHTKVPHKAIMRYILHYTEPGDIVFDGFCGTGMTGVAAQLCGDKATVESLGYKVDEDGVIYQQETQEETDGKTRTVWKPFSRLGARRAVLNDLSPAATFIAYNYNTPVDVEVFEREARHILREVEDECGWMYATLVAGSELRAADSELAVASLGLRVTGLELPASGSGAGVAGSGEAKANRLAEMIRHAGSAADVRNLIHQLRTQNSKLETHDSQFIIPNLQLGTINYTVWSDVFVCPECAREVVFWEAAVDKEAGKVRDEFPCPHCAALLTKRRLERAWVTRYDKIIGETVRQAKQVPVLINYSVGKKRYEKKPDAFDLALIEKIEESDIPYWYPTDRMPEGDESRRNDDIGITHVHHFYTKRDIYVLAVTLKKAALSQTNSLIMLCITSLLTYSSKLSRWRLENKSGPLSGTLYVSSTVMPLDANTILGSRFRRIADGKRSLSFRSVEGSAIMTTGSTTNMMLPADSVNYIFTDPPFGGNLMYSELNFLWEAWLKIFTNNKPEAIENKVQGKRLPEYQQLMTECFEEYYRVLKPGRWMTVVFHNSKNAVWNAIQESLQTAGFVIADVRTLDKKQGSFKQVTSAGTVKQDLVISCYKPNGGLEERFKLEAGTEQGVWDFVRTHLRQLPVCVSKGGRVEVVQERMSHLLYDRMVAFHVQRGVLVPLSAAEFYAGLAQRFPERDGMYFLPEQVAEYDKRRLTAREVRQLELFVTDEASAIQWLKQQLARKPQTFQELYPEFIRKIGGWLKHEKPLELKEILEQNFLCYDGKGPIPGQIISWLRQSEEMRKIIQEELAAGRVREESSALHFSLLSPQSSSLITRSKDRWYVPDPNRAADLEKLRDRALLREFEEYRTSKQRKLKVFRLEAVRAGFKKAWQERNYATIIEVARKIPENVLQEDPKLLMWYDQALTRTGEGG